MSKKYINSNEIKWIIYDDYEMVYIVTKNNKLWESDEYYITKKDRKGIFFEVYNYKKPLRLIKDYYSDTLAVNIDNDDVWIVYEDNRWTLQIDYQTDDNGYGSSGTEEFNFVRLDVYLKEYKRRIAKESYDYR